MLQPLPGEIWELNQLSVSTSCHPAPRYVMIVTEPEVVLELPIVSIMLLSEETNFLSEVDILIPSDISGLKKDLLAETWLVFPMFVCDLRNPTGARLSYQVYEALLNIGDSYYGLLELPTNFEIHELGLHRGSQTVNCNDILKGFHSSEQTKTNVLRAPTSLLSNNYNIMSLAEQVLNQAAQTEQDLMDNIPQNIVELTPNTLKTPIKISRWLESIHEPEWQITSSILKSAVATRSSNHREYIISTIDEVSTLIKQLSLSRDEAQKQSIAKRLGEIGKDNQSAIQALIKLVQTTQDDETLWTAVESLWQIDPGNSAVGVRRVKLIDLGIQLAGEGIALAVALIPKVNNRFGILLQVYPTGREIYLPPQLKLALLDTTGKVLRKVTAQLADVFVQLKFSGELGEPFSVKISLGEAEITENFVI